MRWSLSVAGCSTSGTHERDLVPPGNAPSTESGGGTVGLVRWERNRERTLLAAARRARLCSLLLDSDLGGWDKRQAGGVVVTILTSEGSRFERTCSILGGCHSSASACEGPRGDQLMKARWLSSCLSPIGPFDAADHPENFCLLSSGLSRVAFHRV